MTGVERVPYRLPEVVAADTVWVVEGEKDADNLIARGLVATCNVGGAGKWRRAYARWLVDKHVFIVPDNDAPGRQHAMEVAAATFEGAASCKVVELPGLPEKGDVSDWFQQGHGLDELLKLAHDARPWVADASGHQRTSDWQSKLLYTANDNPRPHGNEHNALVALRHAPELADLLRYNALAGKIETRGLPQGEAWVDLQDHHAIQILEWMQRNDLETLKPGTLWNALECYARELPAHEPVQEHLASLRWDGVGRLSDLFPKYFGATEQDPAYLRAVARCAMVQAVARAFRPGCKADLCVVLEGPQGCGKSTSLAVLGGPWFKDQLAGALDTREAKMSVTATWILEMSELAAISHRKAEIEHIKAFISQQTDEYREPFARKIVQRPRRCTLWGTTNRSDYLHDETGNRRFGPVRCGLIDLEALRRDRDQLWAEAVAAFRAGEPWHFTEPHVRGMAAAEQGARMEGETWEAAVASYLEGKAFVTLHEVASGALGFETKEIKQHDQRRLAAVMRRVGWRNGQRRLDEGVKHGWWPA
jgi:hypothetical protein